MPREKYYKILGLSSSASENEVRKKYRLLAMKFHPDKNPSAFAQNRFIEITEAYEILTGKQPTPSLLKTANGKTKQKTKEERVKAAQQRYKDQILKEYLENERYYKSLINGKRWKVIKLSAFVGAVLSLFIILDYFLPHHFQEDSITEYKKNVTIQPGSGAIGLIKTKKKNFYWVSRIDYELYGKTRDIYIETSWIFHNAIKIHGRGKIAYKAYSVHFNFYSFAWVLVIFFLIPLGTVIYKRKKISFTFFYFLSYYGVNALILIYFFSGNRWAHALSLGFI